VSFTGSLQRFFSIDGSGVLPRPDTDRPDYGRIGASWNVKRCLARDINGEA